MSRAFAAGAFLMLFSGERAIEECGLKIKDQKLFPLNSTYYWTFMIIHENIGP